MEDMQLCSPALELPRRKHKSRNLHLIRGETPMFLPGFLLSLSSHLALCLL
jgi:hypothetical protein